MGWSFFKNPIPETVTEDISQSSWSSSIYNLGSKALDFTSRLIYGSQSEVVETSDNNVEQGNSTIYNISNKLYELVNGTGQNEDNYLPGGSEKDNQPTSATHFANSKEYLIKTKDATLNAASNGAAALYDLSKIGLQMAGGIKAFDYASGKFWTTYATSCIFPSAFPEPTKIALGVTAKAFASHPGMSLCGFVAGSIILYPQSSIDFVKDSAKTAFNVLEASANLIGCAEELIAGSVCLAGEYLSSFNDIAPVSVFEDGFGSDL